MSILSALKQLLEPKVGSQRWFNSFPKMSTKELEQIRETFVAKLFNPNEDFAYRCHIQDIIIPKIDRILHDRND